MVIRIYQKAKLVKLFLLQSGLFFTRFSLFSAKLIQKHTITNDLKQKNITTSSQNSTKQLFILLIKKTISATISKSGTKDFNRGAMNRILILMSERAGNGHKSAANAIERKLKTLGDFEVKQFDCFKTMGKIGEKMEACYVPLTTRHPLLWRLSYGFAQHFTNTVHAFVYNKCKKKMLKKISDFKPDLIVSDQCLFTKAISKLLKKNNLNIPFMISVIDLVNPPHVWRDKNAELLFLPTDEVREQYLKLGFKKEQLLVTGFPINEEITKRKEPKKVDSTISLLMVNPSINLRKNIKFLKEAAKTKDAEINFVCGQDERLLKKLTKLTGLGKIPGNVKIHGYVRDIGKMLDSAHVLLTKAGPNMILEGTRSGTPVIVTGHIPGQEAHNYRYITENEYGKKCEKPEEIRALLEKMTEPDNLQRYFDNLTTSKYNDGAEAIAKSIALRLENSIKNFSAQKK